VNISQTMCLAHFALCWQL